MQPYSVKDVKVEGGFATSKAVNELRGDTLTGGVTCSATVPPIMFLVTGFCGICQPLGSQLNKLQLVYVK